MAKLMGYITLPMILIFIGALISAVGILLATYNQNQEKASAAIARVKFESDLREKNDEITKLNKRLNSTLTGGDSYCYFLIGRPSAKTNLLDLMLLTEGEYPLYDVSVKIDDVEKLLSIVKSEFDNGRMPYDSMTQANAVLSQASNVIKVGNIGPNQALQLGGLKIPSTDKQSYNIYITARNGSVNQIVRFLRIDGKWKKAEKISFNGEVVKEDIDPDFPRNNEGKINW